jgi:hypothetical protein
MADSARGHLGLTAWDVDSGHAMRVHIYTLGDSVTLLLNGSTVATRGDGRALVALGPDDDGEPILTSLANGASPPDG